MKNSFYKTLYNYNIKNYFNNNFWGFFLNYCIIKFRFDYNKNKLINNVFDKAKYLLNFQFDNNSNVFFIDTDVDYQIKDVSNLNSKNIESITNSFFNYEFEDTLNVFLYKFLVLKNNDKFTLLAMIHPLIFNYSSINDFYELFYNVNNVRDENYLTPYYEDVKNYLNSSDYDNDSDYWRDIRLNAGNYVKFHNLKSDNYNHYKIKIDKEPVLNFINSHDCSLFNFYACAFSLYMSRINRQEGCLLKTNIPSRGASLKTILKFDLNSDCSFADYLHQFTSIYDEAVSHTKVSIENYMGEDLSYYSIYDFSDLNENISIYNGDDSALTLNIYDGCLEIVYNADLFSDIYIQHMADNIKSLINNVIEFPDYILKDVNILSDNEKKLLSDFCKGEDADVDEDLLIARYFRQHALENPDAIAVDDGVNQVSYGELEKSSNSIANDLFENYNISLNSHVGLILPRNYHYPELVLALNKIGAVFIPIDTIYPVKRIEHMLEISEAECVVTTKDIADKFDFDLDIICIEDLNCDDEIDFEIMATDDNLFSIMFTSGTTGLPKGVKVTNHQVTGLFESFKNIFSFSYGDIIGCYLSFSFIASYVIFLAFLFGGGCRIFNENEQKDILSLMKILKENPMNSLFLPPTLAVPILESGDIKLDYLVLAGGKLKELSKRERNTRLINFYGTTEIIFGVTKVYDFEDIEDDNLPIGRPVTNTNVYILDEHANQMPIGVPGEICVSSDYISPGYYNNPELTNEVFVDNPYCDGETNKIMYRTGDIGFYNFDGDIEIMGREDDQLSVRGFRIESSEILNIVNGIPEIENVYLDVENDTLSLYYTTNAEIDIDFIKKKLMDELPNYMVPSLFMELEEIPLNMNGKIDKVRLKKMFKLNSEIDIGDEVLSGVVDAFKEVLDTDLVLIDDNFVELGGNSLSAMNLQILLREKFYASISSQEIIELSTPNNISEYIKSNFKGIRAIEEIKYTFDEGCPLSESQLNVYLDEMTQDMGTKYNNPFIIEFQKKYSVDQIKNALIKLFDVHPTLKGRIIIGKDEMPSCIFDAEPEILEESLNDIQSFVRPFDLEKCLSRFLIMVEEDSTSLCMDLHHVIFDGSSINILLNTLYSILNGKNVDFVDDGILRQISFEENLPSEYLDGAKTFMTNVLADRDEVQELMPSVGGDAEFNYINTFDIDGNELNGFLQDHSITRNQFFSSVFAYTLSRFTGSSKVLFHILEDGRGHIDLFQSVGMFVKTLPIIMDCKNQTVDSFLEYSSSLVNTVMKYDMYPFRLLANEFDLNFDISFQYAHNLFSTLLDKDEYGYCVNDLEHDPEGDLSFYIFDVEDDKLGIRILYSDKFSNTFIETFTKTYMLILQEMLNVCKLEEINYIGHDDINILDSYNDTEYGLVYEDVLDAFNDNLAKYPDSPLVSMNNNVYSHAESAFIAYEIVKLLKQSEIKVNDCVAFVCERSESYLFNILSILSIGAVPVPIDNNLPQERIEFMIKDSNSKVVITDDDNEASLCDLSDDITILNVSRILECDIGTLSSLPFVYGDLAGILYTSGTTGIPKGVKITRKAVLNLSAHYVDAQNLTEDDVYALYTSIGFDAGYKSIFKVLYSGAQLVIIPEDIKYDMVKLNEYLIKNNVGHVFITTQVSKLFMQSVNNTSLKVLSVGGEKLGEFESPDDYVVMDDYGPTEAFAFITSIDISKKIDDSSIGILNCNSKAYVLDGEGRRVPCGAVGELYLAGYQIADGYLNREEENAKSFVDNPFDGGIMYRTGDMVRMLPDNTLAIVGRQDSQVKIRGNRVELTEVESVIRNCDIVEDVTVQTINNMGNNELVAYVVVSSELEGKELADVICEYVGTRKPDYMVPSYVITLDEIPLNVNGKVDKHALPEVDISSLSVEYVAPTNETEEQIVVAFEAVFNQKCIGLNDDFIRMGGDSIMAIRLISLLEKDGISCSARDILNYKTPYLIAQNVEKISKKSYDATVGEVDLLPIQSYFFDQINSNEFTQEFVLKSKDYLDLDTLQSAFDELTNVHDMLRSTYKYDNGEVIQEVLPLGSHVCEIKEYVAEDLNKTIKNIINESKKSLDIGSDLIKISLIRYGNESYVIFVIHHLIIDGISWSILIDDLTYIINQVKDNGAINLSRPYPYKNWVRDVKSLVEDISDEEKQQWITINNLLDDSLIKGESKRFNFNVDAKFDVGNLLMISEEEYLALCIARAYKKTYNQTVIFNRESYGRDEILADVGGTVGWFTSQFPVPVDTNNKYDTVSLMRDVYNIKEAFKGVDHLGLNYESLIYTTNELEYKHCPVTFNFLSGEFLFENELFKSINLELFKLGEFELDDLDYVSFGISLNVSRVDNHYFINGEYADGTYLGDKFAEFIENINYELEYIGDYDSNVVSCCLSESQLGIYLDEKVNEMGTAYSTSGILECPKDSSVGEIENAIHRLIDKHPVLRSRVVEGDVPLLVCDSYPSIETIMSEDYSELIKPFDLNESLASFYIIKNDDGQFIFYDMHHIINDATSRTIINKELVLALEDKLDDDVDLGFVYASRDSFNSQFESIYDEAYEFYRNNLYDIDETSTLLEDIGGVDNAIRLPIHDIRENVEIFCRNHGITVSNFFNAVFAYTYSRFTGMNKVYYNFTENGRHEDYTQDALGMFVRTIPIIVDCEKTSVIEYLSDVSDLILDSMKYSVYPFRLLAHEFDLNNDVFFEYNSNLNDVFGVVKELIIDDVGTDLVSDFLCVVNNLDDGYLVNVESCSKYSNDTIIRFLNVFNEILRGLLEYDILSDINYLSNDDLILLNEINDTGHDLKYDDVLDAFNDNLSKYPNNPLVLGDDISYTYAETAFVVDKIQKLLNDKGIGVNDKVSVFVERNHWILFSNLAVLSVGASYVPIDENHPVNRMKYMVENSQSKAIITTNHFQNRVDELIEELDSSPTVINVSSLTEDVGKLNSLTYHNPADNDVACILFTSGTTGNPKAVQVGRHSIANMVSFYAYNSEFTSDDVYGIFASVGFDVSLQHYAALLTGGAVIWVPNDIKFNISKLNEYFIRYGVTHTIITTQVSKLFIQSIDNTSIKNLCAVGEKLGTVTPPENYEFFDVYGPTEATSSMTSINVRDKIDNSSVGGPDWNTKIYVLDSHQRRVPFGAVGELYISGYQVSKGYLNNAEANKGVFFNNPFDSEINGYETMYKTGDVVRLLPDGTVGFIGRNDSQVKIRGNRVELSEIESAIREIEYVCDVTVQTVKHDENNEIVAYTVVNNDLDGIVLKDSICDYVSEHKPDYMVPAHVIKLDEIPLNVNGKVDKRVLPEINMTSLRAEYVAPRNKVEKDIVDAFEKVFGQNKISIYDDFTRLGGDSLTAINLLTILGDYNLSAGDILSLRTPHAIADAINKNNVEFDLDVYSIDSGCPLNEYQLNVYLDIVVNEKTDAYLIPINMEFSNDYSLNEIIDGLNEMFEVHPILNMCISDEYDVPHMVRNSKHDVIVESDVDDDFILEFLTRSFDLHESLCRFLVIENDDSYELYAVFHHIICDARSCIVFKENLLAVLNGQSLEVDDSFLKVSAFTQQIQESVLFTKASNFYDNMLVECNEVDGLLDSINADGPGTAQIGLDLDSSIFLNQTEISENVLFTCVFAYTLSRFTGNDNALFSILDNGRDRFDDFNAFGMYVNTLPLLVDCSDRDISSFIEYMSSLIYEVKSYNYYPFRLLAKEYDIDANILFQFIPEWMENDDGNVHEVYEKLGIIRKMDDLIADLTFEVLKKGNEYYLNVIYCDKYSKEFIDHFIHSYKLILHGILDADKLSEINYISDDDIKLLDGYNQTDCSLHYDDILDAFNDNLLKYPQNDLVSYKDVSYSYAEGAYIADVISKKLLDLGVEMQDSISFLVPRSELYMFCVLGIMSIGGIYIPLDENLPDERIKFMINDTESKVVIVSDETYERGRDLAEDCIILNISDIFKCEIKSLSKLDVSYGDLACILYTSGSTGIPKGVKITRKSIINFIDFHVHDLEIRHGDVYGLFASIGFDVAMAAIFSAIYSGACLNVIPDDIKLNIKLLNEYIIRYDITHSFITTQIAKLFISEIEETSLKVLVAAGEKLGQIDEIRDYRIVDGYGPTEACVYVISVDIKDKIDYSSVGHVLINTKAYILDKEFRQVPIGAVGELYLSGYPLADGYLNRSEETNKAFFTNPFEENDEYSGLYCTGDVVRLLPDGTYGIIGRRDSQIKVRGNRIELSEVEAAIREMDIIDDVTVQVFNINENNELITYVVSDECDEEYLKDLVCDYVSKHKPDYMVPSFVMKLENIPLNINGKVDKHALPDIDMDSLHEEYVAPRDENEEEIVKAFENALNLDKIGIYDDFVRLGGDSLTAIKLLNYIESDDVTMADIFTFRTPEAIAKNMSEFSFDLDIYSLEEGCPLNSAQINVFADVNIYNKKNAYHVPGYIPISKKYGLEKIMDSLDEILDMHPVLSTHLIEMYETNDADVSNSDLLKDLIKTAEKFGIKKIMDIVKKYGIRNVKGIYKMLKTTIKLFKGEYPYLVMGEKPPISVQSKLDKAIIIDFFAESFDLYNYLSKFMIVESEESYYLFYMVHHIIFDAMSAGVFKRQLITLLDGGSIDFDDTFLKSSAFTHQIKNTEKFDEAAEFYQTILSDLDDVDILLEDNPSAEGYKISSYDLKFDKTTFKSFLRNTGISENVLFTSVFSYALSQFVNGNKVIFTMIENGRDRFDENFIGMTSNVMPVVIDCNNQSINSYIDDVADTVYGVLRHSYYPILLLYQKYDFEVNILFQFVPNWIADEFTEDVDSIEDIDSEEIMNYVLNNFSDYLTEFFVQVYQNGDDYTLFITHSKKYSDELVEDFKNMYITILSNIINSDISSDLSNTL